MERELARSETYRAPRPAGRLTDLQVLLGMYHDAFGGAEFTTDDMHGVYIYISPGTAVQTTE
jgi:hypothetical protein